MEEEEEDEERVHTSCCLHLSRVRTMSEPTQGLSATGMLQLETQSPGRWIATGGRHVREEWGGRRQEREGEGEEEEEEGKEEEDEE